MKGGLVIMLTALRAMKETGALDDAEIRIVLSGDEERTGVPIEAARRDMIAAAKHSDVALEFEPSARLNGQETVSIGRRSSTTWHLETSGLSGHSSQIFGRGSDTERFTRWHASSTPIAASFPRMVSRSVPA
jgi:glutamate carboxypeptidase